MVGADMTKKISLTQQTYEALKNIVVTGRLMPGSPLNIREIGAQLGVSAGAVREALSRLSAERLVVSESRGFSVAPLTIDEIIDLGRTRAEVGAMALRRAIDIGGAGWEDGVREAMRRLKATPLYEEGPVARLNDAFMVAYENFVQALLAACDRIWVNRVSDWLAAQSSRSRSLALATPRHDENLVEMLEKIMDLSLARNKEAAVALWAIHINEATQRLAASLTPALDFLVSRQLTPVERAPARRPSKK